MKAVCVSNTTHARTCWINSLRERLQLQFGGGGKMHHEAASKLGTEEWADKGAAAAGRREKPNEEGLSCRRRAKAAE
jgi:hypothetical protein